MNFMAVKNDWMKVKLKYLINGRWAWYAYMYILWWMWNENVVWDRLSQYIGWYI